MSDPPTARKRDERNQRSREVRSTSIPNRMMPVQLRVLRNENDAQYPDDIARPKTRGDCKNTARPCAFVSCRWHLYLDVLPKTGSLKLNFPDLEPEDLQESCALDVADRGVTTTDDIAPLMNMTRMGVQRVEARVLRKLRKPLRTLWLEAEEQISEEP